MLIAHKHMNFLFCTSRPMEKSVLYLLYGSSTIKVKISLDIQRGNIAIEQSLTSNEVKLHSAFIHASLKKQGTQNM